MGSFKEYLVTIPGWGLMIAIAIFSTLLSKTTTVGSRQILESVTLAILVGLLLKNFFPMPTIFNYGIFRYEAALKLGIVFLGIGLSFFTLVEIGGKAIILVVLCLIITPTIFYFIGRKAGLTKKMNILIGIGTTICGTTAIAITAPLIEAERDDISYSIATISLFGLLAMFLFPIVGRIFELNQSTFGLWAGMAIHATPQVVAAGYMYGDTAGQISTITKLTRNIFMAPAVFLIGLWYIKFKAKTDKINPSKKQYLKAIPLFLFGFVIMALIRTLGDSIFSTPNFYWQSLIQHINGLGKFLILIAMAGIGLNTHLTALRQIGPKPILVGLASSLILAIISLVLIDIIQ